MAGTTAGTAPSILTRRGNAASAFSRSASHLPYITTAYIRWSINGHTKRWYIWNMHRKKVDRLLTNVIHLKVRRDDMRWKEGRS